MGNSDVPALDVKGLSISFGTIRANDDVSFHVNHGEIHALLGENGAGKSTLVKMLYGVYHPDSGRISVDGNTVDISSPSVARQLGIGLVFQDMRLIPALKVWENIALFLPDTPALLEKEQIVTRISEISARWKLEVDPMATVDDLSIGEWQRVELLKVLLQGAKILILDEPTSVLTPDEVESLFAVIRRLQRAGTAIIIITHKMREVREIADNVTVLRKGKVVMDDVPVSSISDEDLIEAMVGHSVSSEHRDSRANYQARPILELAKINVQRPDGTIGLADVSLRVYPGEVLGIAGISGNGQEELADVLSGYARPESGDIVLADKGESGADAGGFASKGITCIPSDPIRQMVVPGLDIASHVALWEHATNPHARGYDVSGAGKRIQKHAAEVGLRIPPSNRILSQLSGGNIQRVILSFAIALAEKCIIASYPTRGLDVGTTADTRRALLAVRERGCAVVLISEDIDEILEMSDRVIVLGNGRIRGCLSGSEMTRSSIGRLMAEEETEQHEARAGEHVE